jgi:hypothetical protein
MFGFGLEHGPLASPFLEKRIDLRTKVLEPFSHRLFHLLMFNKLGLSLIITLSHWMYPASRKQGNAAVGGSMFDWNVLPDTYSACTIDPVSNSTCLTSLFTSSNVQTTAPRHLGAEVL